MDERSEALRRLPAVGTLVNEPEIAPLIERYGRALVTAAVRDAIGWARRAVQSGGEPSVSARDVERAAAALSRPSLRPVINATGVVVHTNLGRAPLAEAARVAAANVSASYSTLEFDVAAGTRGSRHDHVSGLITSTVGAEDGIAVNNCAGAVLIMLAALCRGREVIVARGELVEIGGGFRVPDVMRESGATLVEVGTTNKVHPFDYEGALSDRTAAILNVHRSNFAMVGFTAQPEMSTLAEIAHKAEVPLLCDLGSGLLASEQALGPAWPMVKDEPRPADVLGMGADLVAFSGDKLLGGPQAGILAGRPELVEKIRRHPLARALRADKLTLAALETTLRLYRDDRTDQIPVVASLSATAETLAARAEAIRAAIEAAAPDITCDVVMGASVVGGGSLPLAELPTSLVLVGGPGAEGRVLLAALRDQEPALIARTVSDRVALDPRTVQDREIADVGRVVAKAHTGLPAGSVY